MIENARLHDDVEQMTRHDLKNPLAEIVGMAASLLTDDALAECHRSQVKAIERAAHDSLELINASGDLFKMKQGRYHLQSRPVDLPALTLRIAEETRHAFADKNIMLSTTLAPELGIVQGDALLIYSMLHNLTKNAAEAVKEGETVRIELLRSDNRIKASIHNPGKVPIEVRDRFFERYATHGKKNGSGLGTYSAKLIAQVHAGTISMETSKENGTRVTVSLPLSAA